MRIHAVEYRPVHGEAGRNHRRPIAIEMRVERRRLEPVHADDRGAVQQRNEERGVEPGAVKQRHQMKRAIGRPVPEDRVDVACKGQYVPVLHRHDLRTCRRARREQQEPGIVALVQARRAAGDRVADKRESAGRRGRIACELDRRDALRARDLACGGVQARRNDQRLRQDSREIAPDLLRGKRGVDRRGDGPSHDAEATDDRVGPVARSDRDAVTAVQAQPAEIVPNRGDPLAQARKRQ